MGSIDFGSDLDFGPQTSRAFPMMISILVNGESQAVAAEATVSDLLKQLKMNPKFKCSTRITFLFIWQIFIFLVDILYFAF